SSLRRRMHQLLWLPGKNLAVRVGGNHPAIEVSCGASADFCVISTVDEVRAAFERLNGEPAFSQCGHQGKRDRSFADAARRPGNDETLVQVLCRPNGAITCHSFLPNAQRRSNPRGESLAAIRQFPVPDAEETRVHSPDTNKRPE